MRVSALLAMACLLGPVPAPAQTDAPEPLDAESRVESQLTGDEAHTYRVALHPGNFLRVEVVQREVDVAVTLYDPVGAALLTVDSPNGPDGPEDLAVVATSDGEHRLEVRAPGGGGGSYELTVRVLRPASEPDRKLAEAMQIYARSEGLRRQSDTDSRRQALDGYRRALELLSGIDAPLLRARTLRRIGQLLSDAGEVREALRSFEQAEPLVRAHGNGWELLPLLNDAGREYRLVGEPDAARRRFEEAVAIAERLERWAGKATALKNLGLLHHSLGDYQQALDHYQLSLAERWRQGSRKQQAAVLQNIGMVYAVLGRMEEGLDFLRRALAAHLVGGNLGGQAETLTGIGSIEDAGGDSEGALASYEKALQLHRSRGDRQGEAIALDLRGRVYAKTGRTRLAQVAFTTALEICRASGSHTDEAHTLNHAGRLAVAEGNPDAAFDHHRAALTIFRGIGSLHRQAAALVGMAEAERARGRWTQSGQHFEQALELTESVRARLQSGGFRGSFLATKIDDYGAYVDLLMDLDRRQPGAGHAERAFETSERARARSLLDRLASGSADPAPAELVRRLRTLERTIQAKETRRLELVGGGAIGPAEALETELRALLLDYENLRGQVRSGRSEPLTLEEIRRQVLDDETVLLSYHLGKDRSFLWVVGRDAFESYVLAPGGELDSLARRVHELLPRSHERGLRLQSRLALEELSRLILAPAYAELGSKRLVILADGALLAVPFAALPIPAPADGTLPRPLLSEHEVVHLPSASVAAFLRQGRLARTPAAKLLAMVADPVFQPDDPRLGTHSRSAPPVVLRGDLERSARDVGLDRFERLSYSGEEALAILDLAPADASFSALGLRASRDIVIGGELGLTRGFFNAGVPRVVVSYWNVDDRATAELMQRFYRAMLRDHQRPAAALRSAQLSMLAESAWQAPYFWAGFALQGEWR
ncbi:MAG: CHAT domain-containing tetratricopeptide repeat protein [Thermoanaerobaculia bacterium]